MENIHKYTFNLGVSFGQGQNFQKSQGFTPSYMDLLR